MKSKLVENVKKSNETERKTKEKLNVAGSEEKN